MKTKLSQIHLTVFLAAACVLSSGAALAQDGKRTLAVELAQLQAKADQADLASQLTMTAVEPAMIHWMQRLDETVPPAKQKDVREKLDVELKKFYDSAYKVVNEQAGKSAESALVPIFVEKLTEDEMKTIIAYLKSPARAKFQALSTDAVNAWGQRVVDSTRSSVEGSAKTFNAAAERIVKSTMSGSSSASPTKK